MLARLSLAFAWAAFAAAPASPARAEGLLIATNVFTLLFPDGWIRDTTGQTESTVVVLDTALDASCLMTTANLGKPTADKDIRIPDVSFSRGDSVFKAKEGTLSLGGRGFLWAEYHRRDTVLGNNRLRAYYDHYDSSHLFCGFVDYLAPEGNAAVTQFESALATLDYPGSVTFLSGGVSGRVGPAPLRTPAARDALGRSRIPGKSGPRFRTLTR